jgi:hypothetical protein
MFTAVNSMAPWFACSSMKPHEISDTKHKFNMSFKFEERAVKYALRGICLARYIRRFRPLSKLINCQGF